MARGYIFEIGTDPEKLGDLSESDYYESLDALIVDYVADRTGDDRVDVLSFETEALAREYGFETGMENVNGELYGWLIPTKDTLKRVAQKRFEKFRELSASVTEEDFEKDTIKLWEIRNTIKDTSGNLFVSEFGCEYPLLQWLANLDDDSMGRKFYIGNVILMH